ncbi:MAG TPA: hypothetical protein VGN93_01605 [Shinella sp.]|uniref:hypothetical protein n=1 Tax=Shinella sp. TaxID=1870904 RepID=UPI002E14E1E3|nr:hypothetical protein [Shinella sp.]
MANLLSIIRARTGDDLSPGQMQWRAGVEKADLKGHEAGKDSRTKEDDCPYIKTPHRDVWLQAFRNERGIDDTAEALNEFGVPVCEWIAMDESDRQRIRLRGWYRRMKTNPVLHARHKDREANNRVRLRERWRENPEPFRAKMREIYWDDVEATRAKAREKYHRNRDKELARKHRNAMARKAKREISRSPDEIFKMIDKAVSKSLPGFARDEVVSTMCLAVLEGKLFIENIGKEAAAYLRAYNREFDNFKTASLDAPVNGRDGTTFLDMLADDRDVDDY